MIKMKIRLTLFLFLIAVIPSPAYCWGFYGHRQINSIAVYLLPPPMLLLYKKQLPFLAEHAIDPDKRRYAVAEEGPRHYIDMDHYGVYPYPLLPRKWEQAVQKFSEDSLRAHGIVPWHVPVMLNSLTGAFRKKDLAGILKNSAELGHYIADAHVPLHTSSNHNGQFTNQKGIHGFWESRIPELLAEKEYDFFLGRAVYLRNPSEYIWQRVLESAKASDSVLRIEKELTAIFPSDQKYAFEERNGVLARQYSSAFTIAYHKRLNGMVERRMRLAIFSIASFWYTAWVNAGQPDLHELAKQQLDEQTLQRLEEMSTKWRSGEPIIGREE
jgi:hypothetical protein